MKRFICTINKH